jgi:uncharacterized membrane protein YozB (DUF420 family)
MELPPPEPSTASEAIAHSDRLALVDRGRIVGLFDSNDHEAIHALVTQASRRAQPRWVGILPAVNASLNALSAALLLAGWGMIRRHHYGREIPTDRTISTSPSTVLSGQPLPKAHASLMVLAFSASTLFLASYLTYHAQAGSVPFPHGGIIRITYFTILLSHTVLATVSVPLILMTLFSAMRRNFGRHLWIAPLTFPIWLYVATTGVLIYLMLYQIPPAQGGVGSGF